jgi:hypothetical protein
VIGVPSASSLAHGGRPGAQDNLYEIEGDPGAWTCRMRVRGFNGGELHELQGATLFEAGAAVVA